MVSQHLLVPVWFFMTSLNLSSSHHGWWCYNDHQCIFCCLVILSALTGVPGHFCSVSKKIFGCNFFSIWERCLLKDYPWFLLCCLSASSGRASAFVMVLPGQRLDGRFFQKKCIIWKLRQLHLTVYLTLWTNYAAILLIWIYFTVV